MIGAFFCFIIWRKPKLDYSLYLTKCRLSYFVIQRVSSAAYESGFGLLEIMVLITPGNHRCRPTNSLPWAVKT